MDNFTYMLAPMEDFTSNAFRAICHKYGADITFTELIRVTGLANNDQNTWSKIKLMDDTPTVIQLLGSKEKDFAKFLQMFKPEKGFKGFNLNLGCPNPQVIGLGQGAAMIKRVQRVSDIVSLFKKHGYQISIKMRLGLNDREKNNKVYLNLIKGVNADFFIVHARHAKQSYDEPADLRVYEDCVKTGKAIIANCSKYDPRTIAHLEQIGVKGVMIGRPAVQDPSIFNRLKGISFPSKKQILDEYINLVDKYNEPFRYRKNVLKWLKEN